MTTFLRLTIASRAAVAARAAHADGIAFTAFPEKHPAVDASEKMGTVGYCMAATSFKLLV